MIKLIIDSASDIDSDEAAKYGVTLVPMQVRFGKEEYFDGVNLTHKEFFEKLIENADFPQTSQINEYRWIELFSELTTDGDEVIAITISSKLSGTYASAVKASKKFGEKVRVIDSLNACIGERILFEYALRLVNENKRTLSEIEETLNEAKNRIQLLAVLDTLKYLRKGGRISSVTAFAGELLSVKPVVSVIKGEVKLAGKALGSKKGNNLLMQSVEKCGGIDFSMPYALAYSGLNDEYLKKYLNDSEILWKGKAENVPAYMIGAAIGAHVGPGAIAVAFFAND
ncbi:MAG: DegV family protein [Corallococcus sp.]|nr:DegV family protein [Bacillota bacterium]MCM1533078.1 DegV family protein [Corallococcus sp.]